MTKPTTLDAYIDAADPTVQPRLAELRALVHATVDGATEGVSYGMPSFRKGKIFLYFGAFKKHVGVYPPVRDAPELEAELARWSGPKGNLVFPHSEPLPVELIRRVILQLAAQYAS
ncbi:MAG: DUF1801 domain-containing protein [Myxococcota bacterium]